MICNEVRERTVPYLELDLDASLVREVTAHLEGCAECRAEMEAVRQVLVRLKGHAVPDPGDRFWHEFPDQVRRQLAQAQGEATPVKRLSRPLRSWAGISRRSWPIALAASVVLLVGAWMLAGVFEPRDGGPPGKGPTVAQSPVEGKSELPYIVEADWEDFGEEDPDMVLVEMASRLDRRTVDLLFGDI